MNCKFQHMRWHQPTGGKIETDGGVGGWVRWEQEPERGRGKLHGSGATLSARAVAGLHIQYPIHLCSTPSFIWYPRPR